MSKRLTQKQETFCLKYFELGNASEAARLAKYSPRTASTIGRENLLKPQIQTRIDQLRQIAEDASVASVLERKQRLTQIVRATIPDYVSPSGIEVTKGSPNVGAVSEITTKMKYSRGDPAVITNLKLHSPIQAISEINKMEKVYDTGTNINIQQNTINVLVATPKAKELTDKIVEGVRTD